MRPLTKGGESMKRFIVNIIIISCLLAGCGPRYVQAYRVDNYTYSDLPMLKALIEEQQTNMDAAHTMANAARQLGYSETHDVIKLAKQEYKEANDIYNEYKVIYDDLAEHWQLKVDEYQDASFIWQYLKSLGYNDYICAGILGNIMTEVGGNTLDLQSTAYSKGGSFYGICQWNWLYPSVRGASLEEQCNFLRDTIEYEFNEYGSNYKKGFNYKSFLEIKNAKTAATAFAKVYERCNSKTIEARKNNAVIAYNYFIG